MIEIKEVSQTVEITVDSKDLLSNSEGKPLTPDTIIFKINGSSGYWRYERV